MRNRTVNQGVSTGVDAFAFITAFIGSINLARTGAREA